MVVFNCNACGEALKKNQVEKHYQQQCKRCEVLSCVDCGKEFWGNEYETHTKCISEEEKYSGKNFKPKANANKGEQKQELWTSQVQAAVAKVTNARLKNLLNQLTDFPNIPRKKAKFENFLKNSFRVYDTRLAADAWDAISAELNKPVASATSTVVESKIDSSENSSTKDTEADSCGTNGINKIDKKKKKMEKAIVEDNAVEKIFNSSEGKDGDDQVSKDGKKNKRKNKLTSSIELEPKKKKRKKLDSEDNVSAATDDCDTIHETKDTIIPADAPTFKWEAAIIGILKRAPENQLKLKKLRKKVLGEFNARGGDGKFYTEEKLLSKFTKKVSQNAKFKLSKDIITLVR